MSHMSFFLFFLERALDVLKSIGPLEGIEDTVEVATERAVKGLGVHRRRNRTPRGAASDGCGPATIVSHAGNLRTIEDQI